MQPSDLVKALIGVASQRKMPMFAGETFKKWFAKNRGDFMGRDGSPSHPRRRARRSRATIKQKRVILWSDTFNNFFHPETAIAAVEVLEDAGFEVVIPDVDLCCGRPLYDYGMLDTAKRWLRQILAVLHNQIEAGTAMIGLEPSCTAVFRDELTELFPQDEDARRLSKQTFTLAEFLTEHDYQPRKLSRKALLHGHCHHKAIMKMNCDHELLKKIGLDFEVLDSGCCGMAGAFGFEKEHYEVSIACGERVLLPRVRASMKDSLIVADGFSCREQIQQTTDRRALASSSGFVDGNRGRSARAGRQLSGAGICQIRIRAAFVGESSCHRCPCGGRNWRARQDAKA